MSNNSISILLPALDEAETIGSVISKIPKQELTDLGYKVDVVVVDGHSKDMTCEIASAMGARLLKQKGISKVMLSRRPLRNLVAVTSSCWMQMTPMIPGKFYECYRQWNPEPMMWLWAPDLTAS